MKHTLIDIKELSDSKEVYGQRPNPFISAFLYCLVGLLIVAILFSCVGKIDIVATAAGVIRPNDDISTVSSLIGGRITGVYYSDGQYVQAGDTLITVDTAEAEITLNSLEKACEDYENQIVLLDKFLSGIEGGKNPFSSDSSSVEYAYYIQFSDYELSLKNVKDKFDFDADNAASNISSVSNQISNVKDKIDGLTAYKNSVQSGSNQASSFPEYEKMYLLYVSALDDLKLDYQTKREQILLDQTQESNQYYLDYYDGLIKDYKYLVESIEAETSVFPTGYNSTCLLLWNDYCANLAEYQRAYETAKTDYDYYINGGSAGDRLDEILAYDYTMLEGYEYYKQSVENEQDMFVDGKDSAYYRNLYVEYKAKYDVLLNDAVQAEQSYEELRQNPDATAEDIEAALTQKQSAEAVCTAFKSDTLTAINVQILQLNASISEKELSLGKESLDHNILVAKTKMESAENAISTYKNKMLTEYRQVLSDHETKAEELRIASSSTQDKETLFAELETSYQNSLNQKYLQTTTQIDSNIQSLQTELLTLQSNLKLYQIASNLYKDSLDADGTPISISIATIEQISALLSQQESLQKQVDDLKTQVMHTKEQIAQGTILAEKSGILNSMSTLVKGDTITAGMSFATIIPLNESEYKVQLYVNSADIANVEIGDEIKYNITALPSNQYGLLTGQIRSISSDVLTQNGEYSGYYLIEGNVENKELIDKDGNTGTITIGMQVEAKIVTQRKTIIRYLLEKINLF